MNISDKAKSLIESVKTCKGQFIRAEYNTTVKTAAKHKDVTIIKTVQGVFKTGIDFSNLSSVKEGIASGERGEVQSLAWGEWAAFPWIITHKGAEYLRLYPVGSVVPTTNYQVTRNGGMEPKPAGVTHKEWIASFLTPADANKLLNPEEREKPQCITKKIDDIHIIGCWHSEVPDSVINNAEGAFA